jgi:hypothetical protein
MNEVCHEVEREEDAYSPASPSLEEDNPSPAPPQPYLTLMGTTFFGNVSVSTYATTQPGLQYLSVWIPIPSPLYPFPPTAQAA